MISLDFASLLNIVSTLSIVGALLFAGMQVKAANLARRDLASVTVIQTTQSEIWTDALLTLSDVPENATEQDIAQSDEKVRRALFELAIRLETIGYLVYIRTVKIETVDDLMGGVVLMFWSRAKRWAVAERLRTGNPKMHEWCEWIAGQIANRHASGSSAPAYLRDLHWRE